MATNKEIIKKNILKSQIGKGGPSFFGDQESAKKFIDNMNAGKIKMTSAMPTSKEESERAARGDSGYAREIKLVKRKNLPFITRIGEPYEPNIQKLPAIIKKEDLEKQFPWVQNSLSSKNLEEFLKKRRIENTGRNTKKMMYLKDTINANTGGNHNKGHVLLNRSSNLQKNGY